MIIVKLTGGLGNQMFQYAAAKRLAHYHNTELKLDISFLGGGREVCTPRDFQLNQLAITASIASNHEIARIKKKNFFRSKASWFSNFMGMTGYDGGIFRERFFYFDPEVLALPDNTYLAGYWQSEKYFHDIKEIVRREFALNYPLTGKNKEITDHIKETNSVSVHIRRGDFVRNADVNKVHGVCSVDYYRRSVKKMTDILGNINLFVFSDEPSWVTEHMDFSVPVTVVDHNSSDMASQDLCLMTYCKHHIIANSSFSWWGAWLAYSADQQVIAPERWFNDPSIDTCDLIPADWHQM